MWYDVVMTTQTINHKATTLHAFERITDRLHEAGFDGDTIDKLGKLIDTAARQTNRARSIGIKVLELPELVGQAWSDRSNGNQVWAIVRNQKVVTVMLRRSTQPATPEALRVDTVADLAGYFA